MYQLDTLTARADDADSVQAWHEWCSGIHGTLQIALDTEAFQGITARQRTATYELVNWCSGEEMIARSSRDIRGDERGHYEILVPLDGSQYIGDSGADERLAPGAMALLPIDSPFHLAHGSGASAVTLLVPAQRLDDRIARSGGGRQTRILGDAGLPRVCRDLIVSLYAARDDLSGSEFDLICDRVVDLFSLAVVGDSQVPLETGGDAVYAAVRRYIRENATDPDLSIGSMAADISWSPRYIQAVLARHGTTATDLIRTERLELARTRLTSPAFARHNVAAVGASVGFGSPSAFAAAFRRHFGATPRDVRTGGGTA